MPDQPTRITERSNPRTRDLDQLEPRDLLTRIVREDAEVPGVILSALDSLLVASDALFETLQAGGRWFNIGAGTSGRLGLLDAAEVPPTFGMPRDRVQGIIAGGGTALARAVEGAEDDREAAASDLVSSGFQSGDALVAISASGRTPYALSACEYARSLGAKTIAITCAPSAPLVAAVEIPIVVEVGPEVIAGSTRMKGGLAQKMVLHTLSTAVMVRLGRVRGNLMTNLQPVNEKLRERAIWILGEISGCTPEQARDALDEAGSIESALEKMTPSE